MKATARIKIINGREYWYEDIPYYDKEKKQIRHRSKYLGKNIGGKPVKVREETLVPVKEYAPASLRSAYTYGNLLPLQKVTDDLSITALLSSFFSEANSKTVLALAYNRILRPTAMQNVQPWYEGSALYLEDKDLPLSSQRISELLARIGDSGIPDQFMAALCAHLQPTSSLLYDITSLSSSSHLMNLLEYGYNRDGDGLPQLNLSLVIDKDRKIPLLYDIYPGSIADIATLTSTLKKLQAIGVREFNLVLDRGFFSQKSLAELLDLDIPFIIPATYQLKSVKELLSSAQKEVKRAVYLQKYEDSIIFAMPVTLEHTYDLERPARTLTVKGYCFYDTKREQDEREAFLRRLHDVALKLNSYVPKNWIRPDLVVHEYAKDLERYLLWEFKDGRFDVSLKQNAITQRLNRMGRFILFYQGEMDWLTCLTLYRERDLIEKGFRLMKQDLEVLPLKTHKEETTRGYLFIHFLATVIRMRLHVMMRDAGLAELYSVQKLLLELEKVKKCELANGEIIISEISKRNRTILDALKICA
jgi:transposase